MARHRGIEWNLPAELDSWAQANTAVLMDIRDELRSIHQLLLCPNVRGGLEAAQRIDRRLAKKIKLKGGA